MITTMNTQGEKGMVEIIHFFPSQRKGNGIYVDTVHVKKPNVIKLDGDESMSSYSLCNTYY